MVTKYKTKGYSKRKYRIERKPIKSLKKYRTKKLKLKLKTKIKTKIKTKKTRKQIQRGGVNLGMLLNDGEGNWSGITSNEAEKKAIDAEILVKVKNGLVGEYYPDVKKIIITNYGIDVFDRNKDDIKKLLKTIVLTTDVETAEQALALAEKELHIKQQTKSVKITDPLYKTVIDAKQALVLAETTLVQHMEDGTWEVE
jgi:hypothetical protein